MANHTTKDEEGTEGKREDQATHITAEKPNPNAGDQRNGTKNTDVREHTLLEKIAFVVSVCALGATAYQAYTTSDNEIRSLRAYVLVDNSVIVVTKDRIADVMITIKNFGRTPAYDFKHWACAFVRNVPSREDDFPDFVRGKDAPLSVIAPQGTKGKVFAALCDQSGPMSEQESHGARPRQTLRCIEV